MSEQSRRTFDADVLVRVAEAFDDEDPVRGFVRGRQILTHHGFTLLPTKEAPNRPASGSLGVVGAGNHRYTLMAAAQPSPEQSVLLSSLLNLALRRVVESQARAALEERSSLLSNATFEGLFFHVDGQIIEANHRVAELLGCEHEELFQTSFIHACVAPEDVPRVYERLANGEQGAYVITALRKDGTRFRAEVQSKLGRFGERPVRVVAVRDVTQWEQTVAQLRESEAQLRQLADSVFDITVFSRRGIIVEVRGDCQNFLGCTPEEAIGKPVLSFVAPTSVAVVSDRVNASRSGSYWSRSLRADGESFPVEVVAIESTLDGVPVRIAGVRDRRPQLKLEQERRALELGLERAQRFDSLGVMAGGIAHDFNNLLVGILGHADLLLGSLENADLRDSANAIVRAAERAADLTKQLLAYAGRAELGKAVALSLATLLEDLQALLSATLSKKARLEIQVTPDDIIRADPASMTQVLLNLLTNASDALEGEVGVIRVCSRRVFTPGSEWDEAYGATVGPGQWILLEVSDNGRGMDEATRSRIFEPFFTTKPKGHGLGLAACVGIVKAMGGALRVKSSPGAGSCFSLLLPAVDERPCTERQPETPVHTPCKVLIIDDENIVRNQMRRSLELRGYAVSEAPDGLSGLSTFFASGADLLIVDVTMPDIDGAEVVRRIRQDGYGVPIVLSSGYYDSDIEKRLAPGSFQAFLPKPYSVAELLGCVARALAQGDT